MHSIQVGKDRLLIHKMYDIDGDETDELDMVCTVTCQKGDEWYTISIRDPENEIRVE